VYEYFDWVDKEFLYCTEIEMIAEYLIWI